MTDNTEMMRELAACPFCGGDPSVRHPTTDDGFAIHIACRCGAQLFGHRCHFESDKAAIAAWNRRQHHAAIAEAVADKARLDYIESRFSGMTNRERYLPVQMIWGNGCNGRTLREACDKYMARDAKERNDG